MAEVIIFDLDGTLVDSCAVCVDILSGMAACRGVDHRIDKRFARSFMSVGGQTMVTTLLGPAADDPIADLAEFRAIYQDVVTPKTTLFHGVADGIDAMRKSGMRLAICSNKPQNLCENVLRDTGIGGNFETVIGWSPGRRPKPATDLLELTLKELDCEPSNCVFVGDSELDHDVALAMSIPFAFLTYGYARPGWTPRSGLSFDCFSELANLLCVMTPADISSTAVKISA